jgi:hypothetical protein
MRFLMHHVVKNVSSDHRQIHCIFVLCTLSCEVLQSLSLVVFSRMCIHGVVLLSFRCGEGPSFQNRSFSRSPFLQHRRTVSGSRMLQIRGLSVVFFSFLIFFLLKELHTCDQSFAFFVVVTCLERSWWLCLRNSFFDSLWEFWFLHALGKLRDTGMVCV